MSCSKEHKAGILLHITSLPSFGGIGDLGDSSYRFVDFLFDAGISLWQILPIGPTGYGDSPYAPRSSFAGNELMISLQRLKDEGLLNSEELDNIPKTRCDKVEYGKVIDYKVPLLLKAAKRFLQHPDNDYQEFKKNNEHWLDDYSLFMVIALSYNDQRFFSLWPKELGFRKPEALKAYLEKHYQQVECWKALQYFFNKQYMALKNYANSKKIGIIGDIPIFVAPDSADAWANLFLFKTDGQGHYSALSGVPPDEFSSKGQFWGNPVYDWDICRNTGYAWWRQRFKRQLQLCDILRIDHFRGFESYWEIPSNRQDAVEGKWVKGPGAEFFSDMRSSFPDMKIVAEDLGYTTAEVIKMLEDTTFPGMKIGTTGFSLDDDGKLDLSNTNLPKNYPYNCIAYPGTHDNETLLGWYGNIPENLRSAIDRYYNIDDKEQSFKEKALKDLLCSEAHYAVIPMQDILGLGNSARMNTPATCSDRNWSWRLSSDYLKPSLIKEMALLFKGCHRT